MPPDVRKGYALPAGVDGVRGYAPHLRGVAPKYDYVPGPVGRSRHRTSGGTAANLSFHRVSPRTPDFMFNCSPMKIIVFIITALIQFACAAAGLLVLLLVMNGYSESQATPSLILYLAVGLGSAVGLGVASAFMAKRLVEKRSLGGFAASAIAVVSVSVVGVLILIATFVAAIALGEVVRGMR
jgi:hypothetical protein